MKQYENYPTESKCGATRRSAWPPTRSLTLRSVILGILIFALALAPSAAFALGGTGAADDPYQISDANDLIKFRNIVNGTGGEEKDAGAHAKLMGDILDLSGVEENWTPIGKDYGTPYTGAFDGCGYKITGLKIEGSLTFAGLFGYLDGGTVKNLTLDGVSISITQISDFSGGIAGCSAGGTAINCSVAGEISGDEVGGIFGAAGWKTTVKNCSNASTVNGDCAGGIVGSIYGEGNEIAFCSNRGAVNAGPSGGGIVGDMFNSETVLNCCLNNGNVKSRKDAGGIAGRLGSASTAVLSSCSNTGDVEANNADYTQEVYAGGIFGTISDSTTAALTNCSNGGRVSADNQSTVPNRNRAYAGGIAGYINNEGSTITLTYCVNGGAVEADSSVSDAEYCGGIAGYVYSSALSVTKCAYPTGMKALGDNSYGGDKTVSGADARDDAASLVVAVYAEIAPKSIAPGETATITFKTAPGDDLSYVETLEAPASSRSDVAKVEGWNTDKTITVTGVSEGTAVIEFSVKLLVAQIGIEPGEPTTCSFAIPVTVTAIPSDPTDPDNPTDPDDPNNPSDPSDPDDPNNPDDPDEPDDPSQPTDPGNSGGGGGGCSAGFGALALLAIAPLALKRRK